jgi:hypothetical protein
VRRSYATTAPVPFAPPFPPTLRKSARPRSRRDAADRVRVGQSNVLDDPAAPDGVDVECPVGEHVQEGAASRRVGDARRAGREHREHREGRGTEDRSDAMEDRRRGHLTTT